jgi:hypothetical protein
MDDVGNLLRDFYAAYGLTDEGPPAEFNVSALVGIDSVPFQELNLLRTALDDQMLRRQFLACRGILDDLANRLTSEELLGELSDFPLASDQQFEDLSSGVFWFSLASSLDRRDGEMPITPFDGHFNLDVQAKIRMTVHGSLVLRLYVALVYMREGVLADRIERGAKSGNPCCGRVRKLLNSDYVRRIRNALSHGSFSPCIAGIAFRDEHGVLVATPGFLNWLCTWLMLIQLQALAASGAGKASPNNVLRLVR